MSYKERVYIYAGTAPSDFAREKRNSSPPSLRLRTLMSPLCNKTAFFTMESPKPEPPLSRVRPSLTR